MLRRRILASAMASVMAIGSVAVVASAEDTAAATKQMKTKADLEALVKSYDSFRAKEINDYGSISGEKFLDALEYADNVIDDSTSTVDDYTVAYQMVTATYNALKIYTTEELATLVKANKSKYESNNILNDELNDNLYDGEKWTKFVSEYETAEDVLDSKDSRIISDAYENLTEAAANLGGLTIVTKAQFRTALKNYETQKQNIYMYDTWRRGTVSGDLGGVDDSWKYAVNTSYGALYSVITNDESDFYTMYDEFDSYKNVSKTSKEDIVKAYKKASSYATILGAWTPDDTARASKATVKSLIDKYRGALVFNYDREDAYELLDQIAAKTNLVYEKDRSADDPWSLEVAENVSVDNYSDQWHNSGTVTKLTDAHINVKNDGDAVYIPTKDNLWTGDRILKAGDDYKTNKISGVSYKLFSKGSTIDLTDYINVNAADVNAHKFDAYAAPEDALAVYDADKATAGDKARAAVATANKTLADNKAVAVDGVTTGADKVNIDTEAAKDKKVDEAWKEFKKNYLAAFANLEAKLAAVDNALNTPATTRASANDALYEAGEALQAAVDKVREYSFDGVNNVKGAKFEEYANNVNWDDKYIPWDAVKAAYVVTNDAEKVANAVREVKRVDADAANRRAVFVEDAYNKYGLSNATSNEGTDSYGDMINEWIFKDAKQLTTDDIRTTKGRTETIKHVDLAKALELAELYIEGDKTKIADSANEIYKLCDTTGEFVAGSAKGSAAEWTVVYRYLSYALSDKYDLVAAKYTKAQVAELLEKSYDLAEKTGDAGLFAAHHDTLVDTRKEASEWIAAANKEKKYKDNVTYPNGVPATSMYKKLKDAYDDLEKDYNAFKYSFGEIYVALSTYAEMIDEGELVPNDTLKTAMEQTALKLSAVESLDDALYKESWEANTAVDWTIDNDAYTSDRFFNDYNRVFTSNDNYTLKTKSKVGVAKIRKPDDSSAAKSHKELKEAYEALVAEVTKQTTPTTVLGDVNGDGVVNALDAAAILKAVVNNTAIDVAVGDYNADGAVNALDAAAILKFVVSKA